MVARPWFMEPNQALFWHGAAMSFLQSGTMPIFDKRVKHTDTDEGTTYRLNPDGTLNNSSGPIQVILVNGPISKYDFCGSPGTQTLTQLLAGSNADNSVYSILLLIDSPGGAVDGTENFANAVKSSTKPVVTFVDGMMASAAYWIGSSASYVISDGSNNGYNATIGSIGTMATVRDFAKHLEKEGIVEHRVFADKSNEKWGDYFKVIKGDYGDLKESLNGLNETFLSAVQANRSGKLKLNVENVLSGKTYTATQALEFGLIDQVGSFMDAVAKAAELGQSHNKTSTKKSISMEKNTIALGTIAKYANAEGETLPAVEGGYLLTEAQVQSLAASFIAAETAATTDATALTTLQSAHDQLQSQLTEATSKLATTQTDLATATTALTTANATIEQMKQDDKGFQGAVGQFFSQSAANSDKPPVHGIDADTQAMVDNLPHNKKADALNIVPAAATTTSPETK